jgi:exodeoxyribonuclease VII small subunit
MAKSKEGGKNAETFDALLQRLETIAAALERGDLPLEKSLALFEEGMALGSEAQRRLDEAELRVRAVTGDLQSDGQVPQQPFEDDDDRP